MQFSLDYNGPKKMIIVTLKHEGRGVHVTPAWSKVKTIMNPHGRHNDILRIRTRYTRNTGIIFTKITLKLDEGTERMIIEDRLGAYFGELQECGGELYRRRSRY